MSQSTNNHTYAQLQAENERLQQRISELEAEVHTLRPYAMIFESMPFPAALYQLDGIVVNINPAMAATIGAPRETVSGIYNILTNPAARAGEDGSYVACFERALEGEHAQMPAAPYDLAVAGHTSSEQQQVVWTEPNYFPLNDDSGTMHYIASINLDVTERIQQEEKLKLAQQSMEMQQDVLRELSTPLIPITDTVVIMPLIGTIDSLRANQVIETLLEGVAQSQAELAILDITGVQMVDTQVAQAFIQAAQAVRLLGAKVMLTGIQPQIAQTLIHLGVDLSEIITQGSLQAGIAAALNGLTSEPADSSESTNVKVRSHL